MKTTKGRPTQRWIAKIKRGDILRSRSGMLRVVREVTHSDQGIYGIRTSVTFTIKTCSWTGRCYTVYTGNDLVQMGFRPTRARVSLRKKIDREIACQIRDRPFPDMRLPKRYSIACCDVRDIA